MDDDDLGADDDIGMAAITVRQLLLSGGAQALKLEHEKEGMQDATVSIRAKFYSFVDDAGALSQESAAEHDQGQVVGLATVLVASALNLQGQRDELKPSVTVKWGGDEKQILTTAIKTYAPGTDIFNPSFDQAFRIPITKELLANQPGFELTLLNGGKDKTGQVVVPFEEVLESPGCVKEGEFDVGGGALVRASISVRGLRLAE